MLTIGSSLQYILGSYPKTNKEFPSRAPNLTILCIERR